MRGGKGLIGFWVVIGPCVFPAFVCGQDDIDVEPIAASVEKGVIVIRHGPVPSPEKPEHPTHQDRAAAEGDDKEPRASTSQAQVEQSPEEELRDTMIRTYGWYNMRLLLWDPSPRDWSIHGNQPWTYHRPDNRFRPKRATKYRPKPPRMYHRTLEKKYTKRPIRKYSRISL